MLIAHLGFAACVTGIVATSQYSVEHDLKMSPGDSRELAGYEFRFVAVAQVKGPNFVADEARVDVTRDGVLDGAWWQPLSYGLLHGNALHLLLNMIVLLLVGGRIEHILGGPAALRIFFLDESSAGPG